MRLEHSDDCAPLKAIMLAGLCGGAAEVAWVALYAGITGISGIEVARQVAASVFPALALSSAAPLSGVLIHMLLSVALAIAFAATIGRIARQQFGATALLPTAVATLAMVWAANFFVVLPALNPAFVTLMPLGVTLFSKMLFGLAMAGVLRTSTLTQPARSH